MYMHAYTLYSAVRPFGSSVLISTYDDDGPQMCMIDPSGVSHVSHIYCSKEMRVTCDISLCDGGCSSSRDFEIDTFCNIASSMLFVLPTFGRCIGTSPMSHEYSRFVAIT